MGVFYQCQYNRHTYNPHLPPDWRPMSVGKGGLCETRNEALKLLRQYHKAYFHMAGVKSDLKLRVARVRKD